MKSKIMIFLTCFLITNYFYTPVSAESANKPIHIAHECNATSIQPKSDIIRWRYKTVDGIIYKRLYNYTKQQWIGEWQRG